jgi:hypothetical protein
MTILVGVWKLGEPHFSLSLCQDCLQYHHKYGGWILKWRNIQRIDQPRIHLGWDLVELPYIGLKIKDYDAFLTLITPRLAVRLLTEQRAVLMQAMRSERSDCPTGGCGSGLRERDCWRRAASAHPPASAMRVIAMLGNRMARLRDLLGYDLLVPDNSLTDPGRFRPSAPAIPARVESNPDQLNAGLRLPSPVTLHKVTGLLQPEHP